jgi:hypothetical protein
MLRVGAGVVLLDLSIEIMLFERYDIGLGRHFPSSREPRSGFEVF